MKKLALPFVLLATTIVVRARADEIGRSILARPLGSFAPAGAHAGGGGEPRGAILGVDGGLGVMVASGEHDSEQAWAFGVRLGYQTRSGLSVFGRYDDLGVRPILTSDARLQAATFGVRYAIPFLVPLPFLEVMTGAAFGPTDGVRPTAAAGLGVSIPIDRAALDLSARDWLVSLDGSLRQTLALQLGVSVVF